MPSLPAETTISDNATPTSNSVIPSDNLESRGPPEEKKKQARHRKQTRRNVDSKIPLGTRVSERGQTGSSPEGHRRQNNAGRRNAFQRKVGGQDGVIAADESTGEPSGHSSPPDPITGHTGVERGSGRRGRGSGRGQDKPTVPPRGGRRKKINAKLTEADTETPSEGFRQPAPRKRTKADTLINRLIDSLSISPYADCPICFNAIHPAQPIWSCSPTSSRDSASANDAEIVPGDTQCCYAPFHLKCIKSWASKSVKDMRDAYLARGELGKEGEWRCPGCQRKRLKVPNSYLCFCGSTPDPRPPRLATPHSCGNPCSRPRPCNHACPLACHPGPCPPCQITIQMSCHCRRQMKSFRCSDLAANRNSGASTAELSCGSICGKGLGCGTHSCPKLCHTGPCEECPIVEAGRCYCGKSSKSLKCGEGEQKDCSIRNDDGILEEWDGRFACAEPCGRPFDCGVHKCVRPCHPPSTSAPQCPRAPSLVTHCPCGKRLLEELEGGLRMKCSDSIATCGNTCMKKLDGCKHVCSAPCHVGPCPPCAILLIIPCRCGSTTRAVKCHESTSSSSTDIICDKPCTALRACGHHRCNRLCCPLAALDSGTKGKKKGKTKGQPYQAVELELGDEARWHECDLICGKMLGCGNHFCEERDHRGLCPPCLRSSFEEMICHCGQTIIEPPIPCGTRISCHYPCSRPPPPCGHPKATHTCHEDPTPCPPCIFLTTKTCACGKNFVDNIRCSQEKVSCGTTCGRLLDCGFHHCQRTCHDGDCGTCTSMCGKPRKLCLPAQHACTTPCHAPAACSEDEPCQALITLRCPCGRQQQPSQCGRSISNPAGREITQQLKCTNECGIAKRNARLAEALGISKEVQDRDSQRPVTYSNELIAFARANTKFCTVVEKSFVDFVSSERKSQILPHMHEGRRKFVHDLAGIYRMDTQIVDQEPQRSVQLIRRIDTRIPKPLLSSVVNPPSTLGKLADLRSSTHTSAPVARPSSASSNPPLGPQSSSAGRGWTAVVANPAPQPPASAWNAPTRPAKTRTNNGEEVSSRLTPMGRASTPTAVGQTYGTPVPESWENDEA
ncbi:uncharacterized protein FOMMEDRAFT_165999 [Fomitiporia mediterranea MF3/22]|uniref:uncharacterized protein n=1 Tax=Fomitiporia mediterranea (strain MF3/22) TaxID=694068 RepID=UPI0004408F1E|nr:uncharacterized protein FOMMEDRAFT_165999 [Fomitiporia mediterranea MF3/22]EJD05624.1 hypothetical protein FOMMEDRAFT_165999 [Fomitiporia mediterranea MF3/22]